MDTDASLLATAIGARVKKERRDRRWTLDQLAEAAAVSRRMLVSVEQGMANPSVGTLLRISDALGVGLPALVESPTTQAVAITRSGDGAALWTGEHGGVGILVAGTQPPDVVELWDWTLEAGECHTSEAHAASTMELLQVRQGSIAVVVAGEPASLAEGDAISFPGDVEHSYTNDGARAARFSLAVFEPSVGVSHQKDAPRG